MSTSPAMPPRISLVKEAQRHIAASLPTPGIAIDATVGNGYDTLFLAHQVGPTGTVYGFDIQDAALNSATTRLKSAGLLNRVKLIQACHANMADHIDPHQYGQINTVMFNLGYLPGHDKAVITRTDTTLAALDAALGLIVIGGTISIIAYPGHTGGNLETKVVAAWCSHMKANIKISHISLPDKAPRLFMLTKTT